jgi:hypothetical protein
MQEVIIIYQNHSVKRRINYYFLHCTIMQFLTDTPERFRNSPFSLMKRIE